MKYTFTPQQKNKKQKNNQPNKKQQQQTKQNKKPKILISAVHGLTSQGLFAQGIFLWLKIDDGDR